MKYRPFYPFEQNSQPTPPPTPFGGWQQHGGPTGPGLFGPAPGHHGPGPAPFGGRRGHHHGRQFLGAGPGGPSGPGGSKLEYYLQTADRFMATAQQYAPLINRFVPMLSNIPALLSIYKGFSSAPSAGSGPGGGGTANAAESGAPLPSSPRIFQPPV